MIALAKPDNVIEFPQSKNEWYTPQRYIEAARTVMGEIDLDPASCAEANLVVQATKYYTQHDNGLAQEWYGRVWLNPPFGFTNGKSNIGEFTTKLVREYQSGHVHEAVLLSTVRTDTKWFFLLSDYPICIVDHKIAFNRPRLGHAWHWQGTVFLYLGLQEQKFIDAFSKFGPVYKRVSQPKVRPVNLSLWEGL